MNGRSRASLVRLAIMVCSLSVVWAVLAGVAAGAVGVAVGSLALVGFGLDSVIDGTASAVLVWRFRQEGLDPARVVRVERRAARLVGLALLLAAAYVTAAAISSLIAGSGPDPTTAGTVLAGASLIVLPFLAFGKIRLAQPLQSPALHGDGVLSAAGALLAAATLAGLVLNAALRWWWADAAAALVIAAVLLREGLTLLKNQAVGDPATLSSSSGGGPASPG